VEIYKVKSEKKRSEAKRKEKKSKRKSKERAHALLKIRDREKNDDW